MTVGRRAFFYSCASKVGTFRYLSGGARVGPDDDFATRPRWYTKPEVREREARVADAPVL